MAAQPSARMLMHFCVPGESQSQVRFVGITTIQTVIRNTFKQLSNCPGFGQDKVNFCQNPGRGTAGWADPTPIWPNRAGYSIPCAVTLGSSVGGGVAGTLLRLGRAQQQFGPRARFCSAGLFCVFPFFVSLLFLFPLFAVLLNCRYPDPPVSASFFSFSSACRRG